MTSKSKAIWKTVGAIAAGALTFAYLPLLSFAVAPQVMGWIHFGLAAIYPWLGDALLGTSVLSAVGMAIKKIWSGYFTEKRIEKKIEEVLKRKRALHEEESIRKKQKKNIKQYQPKDAQEMPHEKGKKPIWKMPVWKMFKERHQNHRDAA